MPASYSSAESVSAGCPAYSRGRIMPEVTTNIRRTTRTRRDHATTSEISTFSDSNRYCIFYVLAVPRISLWLRKVANFHFESSIQGQHLYQTLQNPRFYKYLASTLNAKGTIPPYHFYLIGKYLNKYSYSRQNI